MLFESLRLYSLCTQFNVLPVSGGVYDQDPRLLKEWAIIGEEVGKVRQTEKSNIQHQADSVQKNRSGKHSPPGLNKSFSTGKVGGVNFKHVPHVPPTFQRYQPK
jgi:hypothetical protein